MDNFKLSPRLQAVASLIRKDSIIADIGTDHGHLVCHLVKSGISKLGYACDIKVKPLEKARLAILNAGLEDKIPTVLTSGLEGLDSYPITDIAIAGMGGELIGNIVANSSWVRDNRLNLVLQPMTRENKLRESLSANGFTIVDELAVKSGRFYYTVMSVAYSGELIKPSLNYIWSGELWAKDNKDSIGYLKSRLKKLKLMEQSFIEGDGYSELLNLWKGRLEEW